MAPLHMKLSRSSVRVAVIGAGPLGLLALKQFKEDGFDAEGFESRAYVGGLWKDSTDENLSVQGTTIFNTSKLRAQASDFKFPDSADTFPTAAQIHDYLESYATHFNLRPHIQLNTRVKHIHREDGHWKLTLIYNQNNEERTQIFDKVCIATGSFFTPRFPKLDGIEQFSGDVLHSIKFHDGVPFKDKNVLLLGLHATTQDCVNSLGGFAKKAFVSHRRGVILLRRFNEEQVPIDAAVGLPFTLLQIWMESNIPNLWTWIFDKVAGRMSAKAFPNLPPSWGLQPAPSLAVTTPLLADTIWPYLESGFAEPVAAVRKITGPKSVELLDGRELTNIDAIIYCTGYNSDIPKDLIPQVESAGSQDKKNSDYYPYPNGPGTPPYLFLNTFPLVEDESVRNSLCFLGQGGFANPGFVQFEVFAMAISQVWCGNSSLPPLDQARQWYKDNCDSRNRIAQRHNVPPESTFYPIILPISKVMPWLDKAAGTGIMANMGGKFNGLFNWKTWKLWWQDRELYRMITKGVFSPTIWRLFDMGKRKPLPRGEVIERLRDANNSLKHDAEIRRQKLAKAKIN